MKFTIALLNVQRKKAQPWKASLSAVHGCATIPPYASQRDLGGV